MQSDHLDSNKILVMEALIAAIKRRLYVEFFVYFSTEPR